MGHEPAHGRDSALPEADLPTVSVVVPNLDGAATLERTLRSLFDQEYPRLEVIVMDGGSTDGSLDVIRRYADRLAWWTSGPDRGQSDAINRGFARATGEVINWLGSDDALLPGALETVARLFAARPEVDVVAGACRIVPPEGGPYVLRPRLAELDLMPANNVILQPSCFFRRALFERAGPLDLDLHYVMDFDLWCRFRDLGARWLETDEVLAVFSNEGANKTSVGGARVVDELERVYVRYARDVVPLTFWHRRLRYPLERLRRRYPGRAATCVLRPLEYLAAAALVPFYGYRPVRVMSWRDYAHG